LPRISGDYPVVIEKTIRHGNCSIYSKECDDNLMKRPWEIYLDMLVLAGWTCRFSQKFDYDNEALFIIASASKVNLHLKASGSTIREAIENLARQLIN